MNKKLIIGLSTGAIVAAGMLGSFATAATKIHTYYAIVNNRTGAIHMVSADTKASRGETLISWNQSGPAGVQGPKGDTGDTGSAGPTGPQGVSGPGGQQGSQGRTGATGPQGSVGQQGVAGANGVNGKAGNSVISGAGTPSESQGNIGDYYIDMTNRAIYGPKTSNGWGSATSLVGAPGVAGKDGAAGNSVLNGSGAPISTVGNDGDFYMDTTGHAIYGPKTSSGWGSAVSLIGPVGVSGASGNQMLAGSGIPASILGTVGDFYLDTSSNSFYGPKTSSGWSLDFTVTNNSTQLAQLAMDDTAQMNFKQQFGSLDQIVPAYTNHADSIPNGSSNSGGSNYDYLGEVWLFAGTYAPPGTHVCDGSLLSISENTALFSIIGTTYGGDGMTNFALPNLQALAPEGVSYVINIAGIFPSRND
jgi:Phage Tail Collar Domain